ncbi:hypothetical protein [Aliikangiella coralliicola]|uniref:Uncharacterized protein n=1 Tax=Aliikangiella coralliicola TaxID=2592383 RepID=A0A545UDS7_9GAMM|nr:hypothetical protein [Aliikangiella coralliicola]TQV87624.1 hypothetical protein FLL46_12195 [Aliikangiella coralliicola]
MKNRCIGCKREIAKGQRECHICGSSQSFVRYHMKSGIIFLLLLGSLAWAAQWYINTSTKQAELKTNSLVEKKTAQANARIQQLEAMLEAVNEKLAQADEKIKQAEASVSENSSQTNKLTAQLKSKLDDAEKRAKKQEDRAGWLSRENRQLKAQIKKLSDENQQSKQENLTTGSVEKTTNTTIASLRQNLVTFENQKQMLANQIALKKKKLEDNWQQTSDGNNSPEILAQREQAVKQATQNEQTQLDSLENQITAIKKQIQELEAVNG